MSLKTYNIDVPITPGVMPPVIHIGQYDSGREYIAHLKNDDGTDYTIPANSTATFTGCNPRKEVFEIEATVGETTVTFQPSDEATSMWGKYGATINITSGGEKMSPIVLLMDVQKAGATDEEIAGAANFPDAVTAAVNDWLEDNIEEGQLGTLFVPQAPQAAKTSEMTQPVGMDENGKLWTTPGGGSGAVTPASIVTATSQMTTAQKTSTRTNIGAAPATNIAKSALASSVQTSLGKADTAVQPADLAAYVPRGQQATKTSGQTQAVGIDANGKLWVEPPGSGGGGTVERFNVHITDTGNGYVSDKSFTQISVADAAGQIIVPSYNYFEGRVIKLTDSYAIVAIVDLTLPQIPILWTFTITDTGTNGYGTDIGGAAYVYLTESGGVYDIDPNYTPEILRTRQNILNYFYDGIAVKLMVNGYAHPLVYHYGDGILQFGGPEYVTVDGHLVARNVAYTWSMSTHIAREVATPVAAELLAAKTSAMTQAVGYDANTGTLWTAPGSGGGSYTGPDISVPTSGDNGKYLKAGASGSTSWAAVREVPSSSASDSGKVLTVGSGGTASWQTPSGGGEGGAAVFEVRITKSGTTYAASETLSDIMDAYQAGDIVKFYNEEGAEGILAATPSSNGIFFVCFDDGEGGHPMYMRGYSIAPNNTVTVSDGEEIYNSLVVPSPQSRTAAQIASGIQVYGNTIYTISGEVAGFTITTNSLPTMNPGECIEIRLTVGSSAITTPTWPSWAHFMNGWDGKFEASTYYDILIDDVGNVYAGTREVS